MKNTVAFFLLALVVCPNYVLAQRNKYEFFLDDASARIQRSKNQSKGAVQIKAALDAIEDKKFGSAKQIAAQIIKHPQYADFGYFVRGEALLKEAQGKDQAGKTRGLESIAREAIAEFYKIGIANPTSSLLKKIPEKVAKAEVVIAHVHVKQKKYKHARQILENALSRLSEMKILSRLGERTLGAYAQICAKDQDAICESWIRRLAVVYPVKSVEREAIRKWIPDIPQPAGEAVYYDRLTQTYKTENLDQTAFREAMNSYLAGAYKDAISQFEAFLKSYPKSTERFRAYYWLGRAYSERGKKKEAHEQYLKILKFNPLNYYGILASLELKENIIAYVDAKVPKVRVMDPVLTPAEMGRVARIEELIANGAYEYAAAELQAMEPRRGISNEFLMYLALLNYEAGSYLRAFSIMNMLTDNQYSGVRTSAGLRFMCPIVYRNLIWKQ